MARKAPQCAEISNKSTYQYSKTIVSSKTITQHLYEFKDVVNFVECTLHFISCRLFYIIQTPLLTGLQNLVEPH